MRNSSSRGGFWDASALEARDVAGGAEGRGAGDLVPEAG
jgi:hypothetical protein